MIDSPRAKKCYIKKSFSVLAAGPLGRFVGSTVDPTKLVLVCPIGMHVPQRVAHG